MAAALETWQAAAIEQFPGAGKLESLYWIGSLAHGGFSERFSDIDVALIFSTPPPAADMEERIVAWKTRLPEGERWSIFWSDSSLQSGRMPIPDRVDLLRHGRLFFGRQPLFAPAPGRQELRQYLREISIPYWRALGSEPVPDGEPGEKRLVRLALYPARFAYSWDTGDVSSCEYAVGYLRSHRRWPVDFSLLEAALDARGRGRAGPALDAGRIGRQLEEVFGSV